MGRMHKETAGCAGYLCGISYWTFSAPAPIIRDRKEVSGYDCRRNAMGIRR